jgi:hypothetical protein
VGYPEAEAGATSVVVLRRNLTCVERDQRLPRLRRSKDIVPLPLPP